MSEEPDPKLRDSRKNRPVRIVVEKWPDGTMAFKFGSALMSALGQRRDEATLVQLGPERIFKVETNVSEAEFRLALKATDVSYHGRIHFSELVTEEPVPKA
jgi:phenolic acid decarboxylase